jgi:hypothetical protein
MQYPVPQMSYQKTTLRFLALLALAGAALISPLYGLATEAEDEDEDEDEIPSAIDGLLSSEEPGRRITAVGEHQSRRTGSWFVWPTASSSYFPNPTSGPAFRSNFLGGTAGRRWYAIAGPLRYSIEAALSAEFPLGPRTHGRLARAYVLGGPRSRYLSLLLGPVLSHNELHLDAAADLGPALFAGGEVLLLSDLGLVTLHAGIEPLWRIRGDRPPTAYDRLGLPGFGDEFSYVLGATCGLGPHWRLLAGDRIWLSSIGVYHHPSIGLGIQ